jgi:hypothetical protein
MNLRVVSLSGGEVLINPKDVIAYHYDGQVLSFHFAQKTIAVQGDDAAEKAKDWFLSQVEYKTVEQTAKILPSDDLKMMYHKNAPFKFKINGTKPDKLIYHVEQRDGKLKYITVEDFIKSDLKEYDPIEGKFRAENVSSIKPKV